MDTEVLSLAVSYYYTHIGYSQVQYPYLWE